MHLKYNPVHHITIIQWATHGRIFGHSSVAFAAVLAEEWLLYMLYHRHYWQFMHVLRFHNVLGIWDEIGPSQTIRWFCTVSRLWLCSGLWLIFCRYHWRQTGFWVGSGAGIFLVTDADSIMIINIIVVHKNLIRWAVCTVWSGYKKTDRLIKWTIETVTVLHKEFPLS